MTEKQFPADGQDIKAKEEIQKIVAVTDYIENDHPFERCFDPVPETYYRKPTGNIVLPSACKFCSFKHKCWDSLQTIPSRVSKSANPPEVDYILIGDGNA